MEGEKRIGVGIINEPSNLKQIVLFSCRGSSGTFASVDQGRGV